ncbi:hypothetical protein FOA52_002754 [Chlamydomonas sp. UWO 241]|nr:hypothetical protein FOA52_002754 [Chlamydomonas sp. UWO 241]
MSWGDAFGGKGVRVRSVPSASGRCSVGSADGVACDAAAVEEALEPLVASVVLGAAVGGGHCSSFVGGVDVDGCTALAVEDALEALVASVLLADRSEDTVGCRSETGPRWSDVVA